MTRMPHWPIPYGSPEIDLKLFRIKELLWRIHNPEKRIPATIHITGTNGKGSTLANLRAIFESANYHVHTYTSPHLIECNERIVIAGKQISDGELHRVGEICRIATERSNVLVPITFFEGLTAMAFQAFADNAADVVLLEVGMGGRLDATNVISAHVRKISVITPISLDHTEFLGNNVCDISKEKAGIIEKDCPVVVSWQLEEVTRSIREECLKSGGIPVMYGYEWGFQKLESGEFLLRLYKNHIFAQDLELIMPKPNLVGIHQYINSATAAITAIVASSIDAQSTASTINSDANNRSNWSKIDFLSICKGISKTKWSARMEQIRTGVLAKMLPESWELWMDGAHNVAGAQMLSATLNELNKNLSLPLYLVHGRSKQKNLNNIASFLEFFVGQVQMVCTMQVQNESRAQDAQTIADIANSLNFHTVACENVYDAIIQCMKHAEANGIFAARVVICGSLYLAGDILFANKEKS